MQLQQTADGCEEEDDGQKKKNHQQQEQLPPQHGGANIEKKEEDTAPNDHQERIERARETLRTIRTAIATCTSISSDDENKTTTLHVGDLRWIHRELSDCRERLAALTKLYRPPFSFRRYRAALLAQQQQRHERQEGVLVATTNADTPFLDEGDSVMGIQANRTKEEAQVVKDDPRRLSGFDAATLRLADDGQLYLNGATLPARNTVTSGAIVLADITNCTIHLYVLIYIYIISYTSQ
jgi:hypothetical protein